jgi:hypothetical protein
LVNNNNAIRFTIALYFILFYFSLNSEVWLDSGSESNLVVTALAAAAALAAALATTTAPATTAFRNGFVRFTTTLALGAATATTAG